MWAYYLHIRENLVFPNEAINKIKKNSCPMKVSQLKIKSNLLMFRHQHTKDILHIY